MATFQVQVEDLVGAIYGDDETALTQWLTDGVLEVTNRCIMMNPLEAENFIRESGLKSANDDFSVDGANIVSVLREDGTDQQYRECSKIFPNQRFQVVDERSIHLATAHTPVYMVADDGKLSVFPSPAATTENFIVYYVNNVPTESAPGSTVLDFESTAIAYFPNDKVYLVVLYASMQALKRAMADNVFSLGTTVVTAVPPDTISDTIDDFSLSSEFDDALSNAKNLVDNNAPTSGSDAFDLLSNEDPELVTATLQTAAQELQRASIALQGSLQIFNSDMQRLQSLKTGYNADVVGYQADVNAQVQEYTQQLAESQLKTQQYQAQYAQLRQEYDQGFIPPQALRQRQERRQREG